MNTAATPEAIGSLASRVSAVALSFWIIKIMCTTVSETGADYLAINAGQGSHLTMALVAALLTLALLMQLRTQRYTAWATCWRTRSAVRA